LSDLLLSYITSWNVYTVAAVVTFVLSFRYSLDTRRELGKTPRWDMLFHPEKYGQTWRWSRIYFYSLFLWSVVSIFTVILLVFLLDSVIQIEKTTAKYDDTVCVIFAFLIFNWLVSITRQAVKETYRGINKPTASSYGKQYKSELKNFKSFTEYKKLIIEILRVVKVLSRNSLLRIYPVFILIPFYQRLYINSRYFYELSTRKLIKNYTLEEVKRFYENHKLSEQTRKEVDAALCKAKNEKTIKEIIVGKKIRLVGYDSAKDSLNHYKFTKPERDRKYPEPESVYVTVDGEMNKALWVCNVSVGGAGICLSECDESSPNEFNIPFNQYNDYRCRIKDSDSQQYMLRYVHWYKGTDNIIKYGFKVRAGENELWRNMQAYLN